MWKFFENFLASLESFLTVWKNAKQSGKFLDNLESFQQCEKFLDSLENFRTVLEVFKQLGKFLNSLENFCTVWKVSRQSRKFLDSLESFQTVWKVSGQCEKFPAMYVKNDFCTFGTFMSQKTFYALSLESLCARNSADRKILTFCVSAFRTVKLHSFPRKNKTWSILLHFHKGGPLRNLTNFTNL